MFFLFTLLGFIRQFNTTHLSNVNLYQLIGLQKTSSERDIKRSFKRYLLQKKRNLNPSPKTIENYKMIEYAFDIIGCPSSRSLYNEFTNDFLNLTGFHVFGYQSDTALYMIKQMIGTVPREMSEFGGLIFYPLQFSLADFLTGGEKVVTIVRTVDCVCPNGELKGCVKCRKEPYLEQIIKEKITLPKGAPEFYRIMGSGLGDTKRKRGANDIIFTAMSKDEPNFKRDGVDIYTDVNISLADAIKGTELEIENFDGEKIIIDIKGGIQHGEQRRIKDAGLPYLLDNTKRGDLVVKFWIKFPVSLTEEQKKVIQEELPDDESFYE